MAQDDSKATVGAHDDQLSILRPDNKIKLIISALYNSEEPIDGDTFWLSIFKIRLKGVDTLETEQNCRLDLESETVHCAEQSRRRLKELISGQKVDCEVQPDKRGKPSMHHNRYLATCYVNGVDLNGTLVKEGWAFADEKGTVPEYLVLQSEAESVNRGMHKFKPEKPWDFRRRGRSKQGVEASILNLSGPLLEDMCTNKCNDANK